MNQLQRSEKEIALWSPVGTLGGKIQNKFGGRREWSRRLDRYSIGSIA